jgi:hypothetical protein
MKKKLRKTSEAKKNACTASGPFEKAHHPSRQTLAQPFICSAAKPPLKKSRSDF